MSWPYIVAALIGTFIAGITVGVLIIDLVQHASRTPTIDHTYLSKGTR